MDRNDRAIRIVNSVLGDARGGRWQVVCEYSRLLSQHGFQVLLLLNAARAPDPGQLPAGVTVEYLRNHGHYDYLAARRARRRLQAFGPDLAIAHCSRSVALLKRALGGRVPVVAVTHSDKVRRLLPADAYLPLTAHLAQKIRAAGPPASTRPCYVVPNMIDTGDGRCPPRSRHAPLRIGALGRFDPVKGFDVFIDALGLLNRRGVPFQAVLGGSGDEGPRLQSRAEQLGLTGRLEFPGWVDAVDDFMAGIDLLCVPARSDAFGLTPLQAAVAGVPMVLSNAAGHLEMFRDGEQALFSEIGNAASTAQQIQRLLTDETLSGQLRQAAYQRVVEQFSTGVVTEKILQAIVSIIDESNK
ncbi:MAG TPA: glycosyltransferase family 1 protein [Gammaproteobacteria bacterium]|nr:glycosyltransferase family 1 protein [Gammaproteobacteria bacterium]